MNTFLQNRREVKTGTFFMLQLYVCLGWIFYFSRHLRSAWLGLGQHYGLRDKEWRLPVKNCPFFTPQKMLKMSAELLKNNTHFDGTKRIGNIPGRPL